MTTDQHQTTQDAGAEAADTRWQAIRTVPSGMKTTIGRPIVARLFRRAVRNLPVRVEYPDGRVCGAGSATAAEAPRMLIHRPDAFAARIAASGLIGFGEAYQAGDWSAPDLAAVLTVFAGQIQSLIPASLQRFRALCVPRQPRGQRGTLAGARSNIAHHYDLSNDFFTLFLDETMTYSSALFERTDSPRRWDDLADAQRSKIDRLLDAAGVGEGSTVLEIGTGWGELAIRAGQRGATVRSITLSVEQQRFARARIAEAGLTDTVAVDLCDYRDVDGNYSAVVSVEMIEAVGYDYLPTYFTTLDRVLADGGRAAVQVITMPHHRMLATRNTYTWVHKYIFPGGFLPSVRLVEELTAAHTGLRVRERLSMGSHYARTLQLWLDRFTANADRIDALGFDRTFRRMWRLYLAYSEAGFGSGYLDVHQFVFDKVGR